MKPLETGIDALTLAVVLVIQSISLKATLRTFNSISAIFLGNLTKRGLKRGR